MGLKQVIGVGKGTVTLQDFERADLIFVIGQNPGTNHPRMLSTLERAVHKGAKNCPREPASGGGGSFVSGIRRRCRAIWERGRRLRACLRRCV